MSEALREAPSGRRPILFAPIFFAAALVFWGNVVSTVLGPTARLPGGSWPFVLSGALLIGLTLLWSRRAALARRELGLVVDGALAGSAAGLAIAVAIALPAVALLRSGFPLGQPIAYAPLAGVSDGALALHVALFLPLGAVVPEELAFAFSPLFPLAIVAALAVVFAGGLLFAALRLRTGTLASTIALHWAFNAAVLVGLRAAW